jgi:DNA-nicking Smr family endonuclease
LTKKISDKDKRDWEKFIRSKEKIINKEQPLQKKIREEKIKKIDLHGFTLEESNKIISSFIYKCFNNDVTKIIVITGKGLRSKNSANPYKSKELSILKYSVPTFINSDKDLMKMIIEIKDAKIEEGGGGAFNIFLKNRLKNKF